MPTPLLGDSPVVGWPRPGLMDARVEPELAHQLLRAGEACRIADIEEGKVYWIFERLRLWCALGQQSSYYHRSATTNFVAMPAMVESFHD